MDAFSDSLFSMANLLHESYKPFQQNLGSLPMGLPVSPDGHLVLVSLYPDLVKQPVGLRSLISALAREKEDPSNTPPHLQPHAKLWGDIAVAQLTGRLEDLEPVSAHLLTPEKPTDEPFILSPSEIGEKALEIVAAKMAMHSVLRGVVFAPDSSRMSHRDATISGQSILEKTQLPTYLAIGNPTQHGIAWYIEAVDPAERKPRVGNIRF